MKYKLIRNECTSAVKQGKRNFFVSKLEPNVPTRQLWKNLRDIGVGSRESVTCTFDPESLNRSFCTAAASSSVSLSRSLPPLRVPLDNRFQFEAVTELDVLHSVNKIKSNAVGDDGISIKFFKLILPHVIGPLTHIINHCFTTSCFPESWKLATIIPIAKISNPRVITDFRPVCLLSSIRKVCESLIAEQISDYISKNKLMSPFQSGFRAGHSCSTALVKILDDIRGPYDSGQLSILCLLDFSKAFDTVDHSLLCAKLRQYFSFSDSAVRLIANYLNGRAQRVKIGELFSTYSNVSCGVPQGSVLGPLLFTLFINDVFDVCSNVSMHAYADDLQLYLSRPIGLVEDLCIRINEDLNAISDWAKSNNLKLNPSKSYAMPISKTIATLSELPPLSLLGTQINYVSKVTNLGFKINSSLSCVDHINSVVSKVYLTLRNLRRTSAYVPTVTKRKLVLQLLLPIITYAEVVYSKLDSRSSHKLLVCMNNATRYVYGLKQFDHVSVYCNRILGCNILKYLENRNCIFLHKIIKTRTPAYLFDKLQFCHSVRNMNLLVPTFNYINSSRLFFVSAIRLWNSVPVMLKNTNSINKFKQLISNI